MLVPWQIVNIMSDLRFTAEETDVLVRAVKDREVTLYGDRRRNPPKLAAVEQA